MNILISIKRASNARGLERIQKAPVPTGRKSEQVSGQAVVAKAILPDRPAERPKARRAHRKKGART